MKTASLLPFCRRKLFGKSKKLFVKKMLVLPRYIFILANLYVRFFPKFLHFQENLVKKYSSFYALTIRFASSAYLQYCSVQCTALKYKSFSAAERRANERGDTQSKNGTTKAE